jgi:hypothetical protein
LGTSCSCVTDCDGDEDEKEDKRKIVIITATTAVISRLGVSISGRRADLMCKYRTNQLTPCFLGRAQLDLKMFWSVTGMSVVRAVEMSQVIGKDPASFGCLAQLINDVCCFRITF